MLGLAGACAVGYGRGGPGAVRAARADREFRRFQFDDAGLKARVVVFEAPVLI